MSTHPSGKNSKTVGINMNKEMANELTMRADALGVSIGYFCKRALGEFLENNRTIKIVETDASIKAIRKRVAAGEQPGPRSQGRYTTHCPTGKA